MSIVAVNSIKIICESENVDKKRWSDFVKHHPKGNAFQTPEMFDVSAKNLTYQQIFLAAINENNEIIAILIAFIQKEYNGLLGFFTSRAVIDGGPLILNDDINVLERIIKEFRNLTRKKVIYVVFRNFWNWSDQQKKIFSKYGFNYYDHLNIIVNLKKSEEELWKDVHKNRKKEIKNGVNQGVTVKLIPLSDIDSIESSYYMVRNLYKDLKLPLPDKDYFLNTSELLISCPELIIFGAYFNNILIGVRFVISYKESLYDWYAASKKEYLRYRPNDILPWEIFKWGLNNKYSEFDFGGAGNPNKPYGVRDYKLKFGGNVINYGRFVKVNYKSIYFLGKLYIKVKSKL